MHDSSFDSVFNQPKEATMQEPTPTPVFDFNATLNAVLAQAVQIHTTPLLARIAVLEERLETITTASDERIQEIADDAARMVLSEHTEEYNHDGYDGLEDKIDEEVEDKVRDAVRDLSFTVTVD